MDSKKTESIDHLDQSNRRFQKVKSMEELDMSNVVYLKRYRVAPDGTGIRVDAAGNPIPDTGDGELITGGSTKSSDVGCYLVPLALVAIGVAWVWVMLHYFLGLPIPAMGW